MIRTTTTTTIIINHNHDHNNNSNNSNNNTHFCRSLIKAKDEHVVIFASLCVASKLFYEGCEGFYKTFLG